MCKTKENGWKRKVIQLRLQLVWGITDNSCNNRSTGTKKMFFTEKLCTTILFHFW